jgi:hypothetical protein
MLRAYEHVWSCEIDAECRQFVNAVNCMRPGVLSQAVYRTRDHSFGPRPSVAESRPVRFLQRISC